MLSNLLKMTGYILSVGGLLGLIAYGIYLLIPDISPYLTRPGLLLAIIGTFGVLLIIFGLILERIKDRSRRE